MKSWIFTKKELERRTMQELDPPQMFETKKVKKTNGFYFYFKADLLSNYLSLFFQIKLGMPSMTFRQKF